MEREHYDNVGKAELCHVSKILNVDGLVYSRDDLKIKTMDVRSMLPFVTSELEDTLYSKQGDKGKIIDLIKEWANPSSNQSLKRWEIRMDLWYHSCCSYVGKDYLRSLVLELYLCKCSKDIG